jgi:hypothetical protein
MWALEASRLVDFVLLAAAIYGLRCLDDMTGSVASLFQSIFKIGFGCYPPAS